MSAQPTYIENSLINTDPWPDSHLQPGGWIKQLEMSTFIECEDDSVPADNILFTGGPRLKMAANKAGRSFEIMRTFQESIERAGFVDIHTKDYKWPIGPWPRDKTLKEVGGVNHQHWLIGMEG